MKVKWEAYVCDQGRHAEGVEYRARSRWLIRSGKYIHELLKESK